jgi:hypothetical protein
MKRSFFIAAAALAFAASGISAQAGTEVTLDGYCNVWNITPQAKGVHSLASGAGSCDATIAAGGDLRQKHQPLYTEMGGPNDTNNVTHLIYVYQVELPLHSGGQWNIYKSSDGINFYYVNGGTYSIKNDAMHGPFVGPNALTPPMPTSR